MRWEESKDSTHCDRKAPGVQSVLSPSQCLVAQVLGKTINYRVNLLLYCRGQQTLSVKGKIVTIQALQASRSNQRYHVDT